MSGRFAPEDGDRSDSRVPCFAICAGERSSRRLYACAQSAIRAFPCFWNRSFGRLGHEVLHGSALLEREHAQRPMRACNINASTPGRLLE